MKRFDSLLGMFAVTTLAVAAYADTNTGISGNAQTDTSEVVANITVADGSTAMSDEGTEPAMGGEGDGAIGGNAPNPDPDRSISAVVDDASITGAVKAKLLADTMVSGLKIDVDTREGVVYLTGDNMSSQAAIDQAVKLAKETSGVKSVESKLAVGDVKN